MGQKHGKATYCDEAKPFLNLPLPCIEALWEAFNDIADGFGISSAEFKEIFSELCEDLDMKKDRMHLLAAKLFSAFDTDKNDLVDAMEFLGTLAMSSGMTNREALEFVLNCYDFDGTQHLTIDEVTLAMKSTLTGLCKLAGERLPYEQELELVAIHAFEAAPEDPGRAKIPIQEMIDFCCEDPDAKGWVAFFDDPRGQEPERYAELEHDRDCQLEAAFPGRAPEAAAAAEATPPALAFPGRPAAAALRAEPWFAAVEQLVPSEIKDLRPEARGRVPNAQLELEWVHGYRSDDVRNNLFYTARGDAVYHAARLGIVLNCLNRRQRYYTGHADDILSLAVHPAGELVATGEQGGRPRVLVWSAETMRTKKVLRGFHRRGVTQLAFSGDGRRLVSVGHDEDGCIALYDWEQGELLFSAKNTAARVYACCFMEGGMLVSAGEDHIYFWVREAQTYIKRQGIFGRKGKLQSLLCLMPLRDRVVSGSVSGHLYVWAGRNCVKAIKAHYGSVNALRAGASCCASGGRDGRVRLWTLRLEPGATFDLGSFGLLPSIRAVALSADTARLLVGTKGGEVYEISAADGSDTQGGPLTSGHFRGALWGLACHPFKREFATCGGDATVRVWDMDTCHLVKMTKLDAPATAIEYSIDGETLVLGLGITNPQIPLRDGEKVDPDGAKKEGGFVVVNASDLAVVYEAKDAVGAITDVKFSPSGEYVAVASADSDVCVYQAGDPYELIGKFRGHQAAVLHVDFSADSEWARSVDANKELCFFSSKTAEAMENITALRDLTWASENCPYVWSTQGIFPPQLDGTAVLCCDKGGPDGGVLAVGDNFGRLRLFRSPCLKLGSAYHEFRGHSGGGIARCGFAFDSSKLVTVGAGDRCAMQWKYTDTVGTDDEDAEPKDEIESEGFALDLRDGSDLDRPAALEAFCGGGGGGGAEEGGGGGGTPFFDPRLRLQLEGPVEEGADDAAPLRPWREFAVAPSAAPPADASAPSSALELEWAHGYRSHDARNNIGYSAEGRLVYPTGALGVLLDPVTRTQTFHTGHAGEIVALALSPCRRYVATGEVGAVPAVRVWSAVDGGGGSGGSAGAGAGALLATLRGLHRRAVTALAFSPDGARVASAGADEDHALAVHEWGAGDVALVAAGKGGPRKVLALAFHAEGDRLMQVGLKHVTFWTLKGRQLNCTRGLIGSAGSLQNFPSCAFLGDSPVVGTGDGHIYVFEGITVGKSVKAHAGAVYALGPSATGGLVSGAKDGGVSLWNAEMEATHTFNLYELLEVPAASSACEVRAVCVSADGGRIAVGLRGSEVHELSVARGGLVDAEGKLGLVQGHGRGEVWGLAAHPSAAEFATCGDDGLVRIWDAEGRRPVGQLRLDVSARALAYSPSGRALAVGLGGGERKAHKKSGGFCVFQRGDLTLAHEAKDSQEWIRCAAYSPDGKVLALGSQDTQIYLYNVPDGYSRKCVVAAHQASVCHLDFSADAQFLRSTDTSHALVFSETAGGGHIQSAAPVKDAPWATCTCPLGWEVAGLWEPERHRGFGRDVAAVARSLGGGLLAWGDGFGRVGLARWPCPHPGAALEDYAAHAPPGVRRLRWLAPGDAHLVSVGGADGAVLQWRHRPDEAEGRDSADEAAAGDELDSTIEEDGGLKDGLPGPPRPGAALGLAQDLRPWVTSMVPPAHLGGEDASRPRWRARLEHVHGARAQDVRGAVRYTAEDGVAYPAAGVGVVYKPRERAQVFYEGHAGDVVALAVSPDGKLCATGEVAPAPRCAVWSALTGTVAGRLPRAHLRAVSHLAWAPSGRRLAALGQDREHTAVVYRSALGDWTDGEVEHRVKAGPWKVLFCEFTGAGDLPLMVGGVNKVVYFRPVPGGGLARRSGLFGRQKRAQPVLCAAYRPSENDVVTGTASGQLFVWGEAGRVARTQRAHDGAVTCVALARAGSGGFVTGGRDGVVKIWAKDLSVEKQYNAMDASPHPFTPGVVSVCANRVANKIVVATRGGEIYEVSRESGCWLLLAEGHSQAELHGLAAHPTDPHLFASAGDDAVVRVWDAARRACVRREKLDSPARCLAWSPDGEHLAVGLGGLPGAGTKDGTLMVLDARSLEVLFEVRKSKQHLTDLKYSPDGARLAACSMDGKCYFHNTNDYALEAPTKPLESGVMAIDFSEDSTKIRAATVDYDLIFYNVGDASRLTANNARDVVWATSTSPFGWDAQGLWDHAGIPQDLICVDRAREKKITISGYGDGSLRLHNFPAPVPAMKSAEVNGFGSKVSRVSFLAGDERILAAGAKSRVICQYKFEPFDYDKL